MTYSKGFCQYTEHALFYKIIDRSPTELIPSAAIEVLLTAQSTLVYTLLRARPRASAAIMASSTFSAVIVPAS